MKSSISPVGQRSPRWEGQKPRYPSSSDDNTASSRHIQACHNDLECSAGMYSPAAPAGVGVCEHGRQSSDQLDMRVLAFPLLSFWKKTWLCKYLLVWFV